MVHVEVVSGVRHVCFLDVLHEAVEVRLILLQLQVGKFAKNRLIFAYFTRIKLDVEVQIANQRAVFPFEILLRFCLLPVVRRIIRLLREQRAVVPLVEAIAKFYQGATLLQHC